MARTNTNTGGSGGDGVFFGGSATGFSPRMIQYIDNFGNQYGDDLFTRDSITNEVTALREFDVTTYSYSIDVGDIIIVSVPSSPFIDGEIVEDLTNGTTATISNYQSVPGTDLLIITNVTGGTGTFDYLDSLLGQTSGATATVAQYYPYNFVASDTFFAFLLGETPLTNGVITAVSGNNYSADVASGTVVVNDILLDVPNSPTKFAGVLSISAVPNVTTLTTGMVSLNDLGGGINGTAFQQSDGSGNSVTMGVLDSTPFGGNPFTAGIFANNSSGDSSNIILSATSSAWQAQSASGAETNMLFLAGGFFLGAKTSSMSSDYGFQTDGSNVGYHVGNMQVFFPETMPSVNQIPYVQTISGQDVYMDWTTNGGGGGGTPGGAQYAIQVNNGASGFQGDETQFAWNYSTQTPLFNGSNGLSVHTGANEVNQFGYFGSNINGFYNYIELPNAGRSFSYVSNVDVFSNPITFTGTGVDDINYNSNSGYDGGGTDTWTITVDSATGLFSGVLFTGVGLRDLTTLGGFTGAFQPFTSYSIVIDGVNVDYIDYTNRVGSFLPGQTITDSTTGATATVVSDDGDKLLISGITGGTFDPGDSFDNGLGDSAEVVTTGVTDTFSWLDSDMNGANNVIITGAAQTLSYTEQIQFGATTGHTVNDNWNFFFGQGYARFNIVPATLTGTFQTGETVTGGTSGATGITVRADLFSSYQQIYLINIGGIFQSGETITGGTSGATAVLSDAFGGFGDTVTWTDGTTTETQVPIMGGAAVMTLSHNVSVIWTSYEDHVIGDEWTFFVLRQTATKFQFAYNSYLLGDLNNRFFATGELFSQNLQAGTQTFTTNTGFKVQNANGIGLLQVTASSSNPQSNFIEIGDYTGALGYNFYAKLSPADQWFILNDGSDNWFTVDATQGRASLGLVGSGTAYLDIDNTLQRFSLYTGGVGKSIFVDNINKTKRFGDQNTNDSYLDIDDNAELVKVGRNINQGAETQWNSADGYIVEQGGHVQTSIRTLAYNSVNGLNLNDYVLFFSGSTGSATVLLDSVAFEIGTILIIKDGDCIASTSNITLDAGTGNTIAGTTVAQTYVMNTDGQSTAVRKISSTQWAVVTG